jgi:steroid delta-isomerase-like uncharacterized protein
MQKQKSTIEASTLAQQLMEMWESGNTARLDEITVDEVVYDDVPNGERYEGREGVRRYMEHVHAWAGQIQIDIIAIHGNESSAVAEWIMHGVQDRPIPSRVPIATNRNFQLKGATIVESRDGKIARAVDYIDVLGFVVQLGGRVELPGGIIISQE